jgi:hypothetical protein
VSESKLLVFTIQTVPERESDTQSSRYLYRHTDWIDDPSSSVTKLVRQCNEMLR